MDNNIFNLSDKERDRLPAQVFNILVSTNLGPMLVNRNDRYVGQSLIHYGEFCEGEAALFRQLLHPGDVAIEAGANIGAHTILFSSLVGESGKVLAFEPQRIVFQTLCANLALNQCLNVDARQQGLADGCGEMTLPLADPRVINNFGGLSLSHTSTGDKVAITTIDALNLPRCHLIKIDVEGMEKEVLNGAQETIKRCRPILYIENDRADKSQALITHILSMGYRAWWHLVPLFNPANHANNPDNIFAGTVSVNMLCQPIEFAFPVNDLREITDPAERWDAPLHIAPATKCTMDASPLPSDEESIYRERIQANPEDHAAWHALGLLAFVADDLPQAAQRVTKAIAIAPAIAQYHCDIGEIYRRMAQFEKSVLAGRRAIELAPRDPDAHYRLGLAYDDSNDIYQALACYRQATKLDSTHYLAWYYQGASLAQQGATQAAIAAYTQAVTINPGFAEAQHALGILLGKQGKHSEARSRFEMALRARPDFVATHFSLSSLKTYTAKDPHLAMLASIYDRRSELSEQTCIQTCFAYGKALEDVGNYELSFAAYTEGNKAQHTLLPVNERQADDLVESIKALFNKKFFEKWRHRPNLRSTHAAFRPVFIVGMPHSGSSVLEKILTSHTGVCRTEVRVDFSELLATVSDAPPGKPLGKHIESLTDDNVQRIGEEYLHRIVHHAPDGIISVDRTLANYFYLGLIHLTLPQAKIIHVLRDPMDTCFSCYTQLFTEDAMAFSYDLATLGRHYVRYLMLMRHWHTVLPAGAILDLHYEDLITDGVKQVRRMLEFIGATSQPELDNLDIAVPRARWKHYAQYLKPLFNIVSPYRSADNSADIIANAQPASLARIADSLHKQQRFTEALSLYEQALALKPEDSLILNNKGILLRDMGQIEEARNCFAHALALAPEMAIARYNLGTAQLQLGDWQAGWENYEARWLGNNLAQQHLLEKPPVLLPQWAGESGTKHQSLLILSEQGAGDNLQFVRYLILATQRFARVAFVCPYPLLRLIESSFGETVFLLPSLPKETAGWDWQCPLMSLPRAFQTQEETIPKATPYLSATPLAQTYWRKRLEQAAPNRLRVGIAWAGNKSYAYDSRRSLSFEQILPLLSDQEVTWVSLQVRMPTDKPPTIPAGIDWIDWTTELTDFADTAALVANLDLVISIDSAMAHLAGAMDRPTWLLNRFEGEWRWLKDRGDSPWYPQMRIFTQPRFGDWNSVIETAAAVLRMESKIPLVTPRSTK